MDQIERAHTAESSADDESIIFGHFIEKDLAVSDRGRRKYVAKGILPPPDGKLNGRNFWKLGTYRKFKADLFAGKFASSGIRRRAP